MRSLKAVEGLGEVALGMGAPGLPPASWSPTAKAAAAAVAAATPAGPAGAVAAGSALPIGSGGVAPTKGPKSEASEEMVRRWSVGVVGCLLLLPVLPGGCASKAKLTTWGEEGRGLLVACVQGGGGCAGGWREGAACALAPPRVALS